MSENGVKHGKTPRNCQIWRFPKIGYPQIIHLSRMIHYKSTILGVPSWLWKPPFDGENDDNSSIRPSEEPTLRCPVSHRIWISCTQHQWRDLTIFNLWPILKLVVYWGDSGDYLYLRFKRDDCRNSWKLGRSRIAWETTRPRVPLLVIFMTASTEETVLCNDLVVMRRIFPEMRRFFSAACHTFKIFIQINDK